MKGIFFRECLSCKAQSVHVIKSACVPVKISENSLGGGVFLPEQSVWGLEVGWTSTNENEAEQQKRIHSLCSVSTGFLKICFIRTQVHIYCTGILIMSITSVFVDVLSCRSVHVKPAAELGQKLLCFCPSVQKKNPPPLSHPSPTGKLHRNVVPSTCHSRWRRHTTALFAAQTKSSHQSYWHKPVTHKTEH